MRWAEISIEVICGAVEEVVSIATEYAPAGVAVFDPSLIQEARQGQELADLELAGLRTEGNAIVRYFASDDEAELALMLSELRKRLETEVNCTRPGNAVISINVRMADESEWSGWKKSFKPFRLGSRMVVSPTWEMPDALPEDIVLRIDPGQAFGTGQHATTACCVFMLERYIEGGERVLDVGTGTGILAIASALLGADEVSGIDIDPVAVKCAAENVSLNCAGRKVKIIKGDLLKGVCGEFDIIVANILAGPIMEMAAPAAALLSEQGLLITSGYIEKAEAGVKEALGKAGLIVFDRIQEGDWICLVARKQGR